MAICERNISALEDVDARTEVEEKGRRRWQLRRAQVMWLCTLLAGLYIGSFPRYNKGGQQCVFGYQLFCAITTTYRYWASIAGIMIIWAMSNVGYLQWTFTSSLLQYFGQISYSMYIIHEPLLHILGFRVVVFMREMIGKDTVFHVLSGFCLSLGIKSFFLLWFAVWIERKCFPDPE